MLFLSLLLACAPAANDSTTDSEMMPQQTDLPELLQIALKAHGGLEQWQAMRTLSYDIERNGMTEHQLVDLRNRKVLLGTKQYQVGFDGKEVWVAPNKAAFGKSSARFYHNLRFYFFAMPFIAADPGIKYEVIKNDSLNGKIYDAIKLTYEAGVGDAPKDEYLLYFDQNTHQMEWLLYTVTYFTGEKGDKYNALHYAEWRTVEGLVLPEKLVGYTFKNDSIGNKRYERTFENIELSKDIPDQAIFEIPAVSEIDSLLTI